MIYIYLRKILWEFITIIKVLEGQKRWKRKPKEKKNLQRKEQKNYQNQCFLTSGLQNDEKLKKIVTVQVRENLGRLRKLGEFNFAIICHNFALTLP